MIKKHAWGHRNNYKYWWNGLVQVRRERDELVRSIKYKLGNIGHSLA